MTNKEAIKELSEWLDGCCGGEEIEPTRQALRLAIHALESEWEEMIVICDNCGHAIHVKKVVGDVKSRSN